MSIESITSAILKKAGESAASTLAAAEKTREERLSEAKLRLETDKAARDEFLAKEGAEVITRRLTLARLESRMAALSIKQELIEKAYALAAAKLDGLPQSKYLAFYAGLVSACAEDGDSVIIGDADKMLFDKAWLDSVAGKLKIKLTLGGSFEGKGIILSGKYSEKDLTLKTLLIETREKTESEVAGILFGNG